MTLKTITVDGLPVETTDAGIAAIEKLRGALATMDAAHNATIAARDAEIGRLNAALAVSDAALETANGRVLDDAALDARVAARSQLLADAKVIAPDVVVTGLSDAAIRRAVVTKALGAAIVDGKPDSYVDARFDILVEEQGAGQQLDAALSDTARSTPATDATAVADAYTKSVTDLNAWRQKA